MRRDYFTVDVQSEPDDGTPAVSIEYDGPSGTLRERLTTVDGETFAAGDIDVTFRRQSEAERGVLALTNRHTGEYVLEADVDPDVLLPLVDAVEAREDEGAYELRLTGCDGPAPVHEKRTLLVYDHDGSLLRQQSLIPGGVEL